MANFEGITAEAICRTCLKLFGEETQCLKYDIFLTPDLAKKLIICTSLTVEMEDEFPKHLCSCCFNKLNEFHQFKTMCVESVQRFREIQKQRANKDEFEDEKLEFDLEGQSKLEITINESDTYCRNDISDDIGEYLNETHELNSISISPRVQRRGRGSAKFKALQVDLNRCGKNTRSTRSQTLKLKATNGSVEILVKPEKLNILNSSFNFISDGEVRNINEYEDVANAESEHLSEEAKGREDEITSIIQRKSKQHRSNVTIKKKRKYCKRSCDESSSSRKPQIYQCEICPTRFFVEHRLAAHKRSHDGLMPYPCTFQGCDKGFNRWHCLSEHLKQHDGTNQWYTCEEEGCSKVYKHKPTLSMHLRKFHKKGPELKSHVCEICGKVFKASAILNDHRYTHKDKSELPFACTEDNCDRRFSSKEKLKVHMMRHAGIKNFVCPYCGMRKTTRNELKIHINYHTLERTWPCRFCQHVCNSAGNLKMHVRTVHERAKDYGCRFCERTFAKPDTRKYHEMTHTGEKPNECSECGKRFTQPAALRTHRKIHLRNRKQTIMQVPVNVSDSVGAIKVAPLEMDTTSCVLNNAVENHTSKVSSVLLPLVPQDSSGIVGSQMHTFL